MFGQMPSWGATLRVPALRRRWWVILIIGIVVAALVGVSDARKTKQYTATATLLFNHHRHQRLQPPQRELQRGDRG